MLFRGASTFSISRCVKVLPKGSFVAQDDCLAPQGAQQGSG